MSHMIIVAVGVAVAAILWAWASTERQLRKIAEDEADFWRKLEDNAEKSREKLWTYIEHAHRKIKRVQAENHAVRGLNRKLNEECIELRRENELTYSALNIAEQDCGALCKQNSELISDRRANDYAFAVMDNEIRYLQTSMHELADVTADLVGALVDLDPDAKVFMPRSWYHPISLDGDFVNEIIKERALNNPAFPDLVKKATKKRKTRK